MTKSELENRVVILENTIKHLRSKIVNMGIKQSNPMITHLIEFIDDIIKP